ncbi:MAG: hypothetical protein D6781_02115 [Verrucomicrobia bacterium]|nr:MAG: hypothetical protein D6781_02115 [Verrucomicrobiota bacterium]
MLRKLLLVSVLPATALVAAPRFELSEAPLIWGDENAAEVITAPPVPREMTGDETWSADHGRVQILHTGRETRTIILPEIGSSGFEVGTILAARVTTWPDEKILFRQPNGQLVAFWGDDGLGVTQWATFEATPGGWKHRISKPAFISPLDGVFATLGAHLTATPEGAVVPDSPHTVGYALRFRTDSRDLFIAARGRSIRFRVLADGRPVARVAIEREAEDQILVPIHLGSAIKNRQVEVVADQLEFAGIEIPYSGLGIQPWKNAVPMVRALWITDGTDDNGIDSYPWAAARLLKQDIWVRSWGPRASAVTSSPTAAAPADAIAADIAAINTDVIVICSGIFDQSLHSRDYSQVIASWLDAISGAVRPDAVRIALWNDLSGERSASRYQAMPRKAASRLDFNFLTWSDWITGSRDNPNRGNAYKVIAADGSHPSAIGHRFLGYCFAESFRDLGVETYAQAASMARRRAEKVRNLASSDS